MSKRILSLVLALVMVLGTFGTVFAADTAQKDAAEFLAEAKVLLGDDKGNLNLDLKLERRDMVVLLSRLMGEEEVASEFPTSEESPTWEDARTDAYYVPFFAWAQVNKFFAGKTEKEFGPREAITAQDYAVVLLRALGYDVEGHDAWKAALADAKKLGILENVVVEDATEITRGQMSVMTLNALAVNVKDSTKTLAETLEIVLPTPSVLAVEEVVADNLVEVKVAFNKDVDVDLTDVELFSIKGLTIADATVEGDELILSVNKMVNKKAYELVIKGTAEVDGTYKFTANDNAIPYVVAVQALGTKAIKITLSEPVNKVTSSNFRLDGKVLYAGVPVNEGKEIIVRPYTELSLGEHDLTVRDLKDYNNFISIESTHSFEVAEDKDAPTVVDVSATLERVVVTFSEDIDPNTVNLQSVYWMEGNVKRYADSKDQLAGNKFAFNFNKYSLPVYQTTIYIAGVKDYSGNTIVATEVPVKAVIDETRPEVVSAELDTDLKTVIVKYNKPVNVTISGDDFKASARNRGNYTILDEKDNKVLINEIVEDGTSGKTFKVVLSSALAGNKSYTIKVSGVQDRNKYANTMYDYVGNIAVGVVGSPEVVGVTGTYNTTDKDNYVNKITVLFSRAMDLSTVADPTNYIVRLEGGAVRPLSELGADIGVLRNDGTLVEITVQGKDAKKVIEIGVLGAKDVNGKTISNYGTMHVVGVVGLGLDTDVTNPVVAISKKKVEVKFNQQVAEADKEDFKILGYKVESLEGKGTKTLTLTLTENLDSDVALHLKVAADKIVGVLGGKNIAIDKEIHDGIAPEFTDAEATTTTANDVVITLTFSEDLQTEDPLLDAWKRDMKVVRVADGKEVKANDYELKEVEDVKDKLVIIIRNEAQDSAYEISFAADSSFVVDEKGNSIEAETIRTNKTEEINDRREAAATEAVDELFDTKVDGVETVADYENLADGVDKDAIDAAELLVKAVVGKDAKTALQAKIATARTLLAAQA